MPVRSAFLLVLTAVLFVRTSTAVGVADGGKGPSRRAALNVDAFCATRLREPAVIDDLFNLPPVLP